MEGCWGRTEVTSPVMGAYRLFGWRAGQDGRDEEGDANEESRQDGSRLRSMECLKCRHDQTF